MADLPRLFAKYEILGELGRGGFATVYRARDTDLDREVALKVLAPHLIWNADFSARFQQEARVAARLKHTNIVTIYETGDVDGALYIAMELAEAGSLRDRLNEIGELDVRETIKLLKPIAVALDYAHASGIVHRDVKPANILLDPDETGQIRPILTDFGLVKALTSSAELTQSGAIIGTVEYMAPEQADTDLAHKIGPASDIYGLGIVAYHMLTGRVPFSDSSAARVLMAHLTKQPPPPSSIRTDLPPGVSDAILRALAKEPEDRFPTATAFVQALGVQVETEQIGEKPPVVIPYPEPAPTSLDSSEDDSTPAETKKQAVEPKPKGRSRWLWLVVPAILLVIILAAVVFGTDTFHPRIIALSYSPANPAPGDDITIQWRTENAQRIEIWPIGVKFSARDGEGHIENGVAEDTELIVIASNWLGEGKEALQIKVTESTAQSINCYDAAERIADFGKRNDCTAVIAKATEYINAGCSSTTLLHYRGSCYGEQGEFELALQDFATAIERDSGDPWNYIDRSEVYERMGENELRLVNLNTAVSVAPGDPQTYFHRAEYYEEWGDFQTAVDDITQAIELSSAVPDYYDGRGEVYREMGNTEAASADFEKFMELSVGFKVYEERRAQLETWLEEYRTSQVGSTPTPDAPTIDSFNVDPGEFVHGAIDTIRMSWEVQGADSVELYQRIAGDESVINSNGIHFEEIGTFEANAPDTSTTYTLVAANQNNETRATAKLIVTDTACSVQVDGLNLRSGPGTIYTRLASLRLQDKLAPQTYWASGFPSRSWVQVKKLDDGKTGWVSADLVDCNLPFDRLPTGEAPPTPTFTPRPPTSTPTPTQTAQPPTSTPRPTSKPDKATDTPKPTETRVP